MSIIYTKSTISDLYKKIDENKIVLPNFQRDFVWTTEKQKNLIASILINLPIGSTLHLEGKKDDFAARILGRPSIIEPSEECDYVLDGQQRLTTIKNSFYNLYKDNINWENSIELYFKELRNRWYLKVDLDYDILNLTHLNFNSESLQKLEPDDIKHLVINKNLYKKDKDKWFHNEYSPKDDSGEELKYNRKLTQQAKYAAEEKIIPLYTISEKKKGLHRKVLEKIASDRILFLKDDVNDSNITLEKILGHLDSDIDIEDSELINRLWTMLEVQWVENVAQYLEQLLDKEIPIIQLPISEISRAAAIFEEVNNSGTPLKTFDLVVAKAAKKLSKITLSNLIRNLIQTKLDVSHFENNISNWNASYVSDISTNIPTDKFQSLYLNLLSMVVHSKNYGNTVDKLLLSKTKILSLKAEEIVDFNENIVIALCRTFAFLQLRCGIQKDTDISYEYMILVLAYQLYHDNVWTNKNKLNKLEAWYWSCLFSGQYHIRRPDEQFKIDTDLLNNWLILEEVSKVPDTLKSDNRIDLKLYYNSILNQPNFSNFDSLLPKKDLSIPKTIINTLMQYVLSTQPTDFVQNCTYSLSAFNSVSKSDENYSSDSSYKKYKLERHHIVPLATATNIEQSTKDLRSDKTHILNSPLNLVDISEYANRTISSKNLQDYSKELGINILGHFLSSSESYIKKTEEDINIYYERILRERHTRIRDHILNNVRKLLS